MNARLYPVHDYVFSGALAMLVDAFSPKAFAPARNAAISETVDVQPRLGFWDRLENWAWRLGQKDREAYLANAQNIADLEERMRRLDSFGGRFY